MSIPAAAPAAVLFAAVFFSVISDLRSGRIPDWVTLPAVALALALRALRDGWGSPDEGAASGLLGAASLFAFFALLVWRKRMEWGDAKLMAVVGAAFGWPDALGAALIIAVLGALQGVAVLFWRREFWDTARRVVHRALAVFGRGARPAATSRRMPYSIAIGLGSIAAMMWSHGVR